MTKSHARGFTLIELLVVIAIIGILSSIVLASLNSARKKGRDARRLADIKQLQLALELYYDANGQYPTALDTAHLVTPGYISTIPGDPSSTVACTTGAEASCYKYAGLGGTTCTSYHIGATLETTNHSSLNSDADAAAGTACAATTQTPAASAADFAGTDPIYDVKP
jgi:prepilin-type N-terminal cleavage/methylation domain-containing protein